MKTILLSLLLAACVLVESCSASSHLGKVSVQKPKENEKDQQKWFVYYQDQLDAYGGNAVPPAGQILESEGYQPAPGTFNQAAIDGYEQAWLDRGVKEKIAARRASGGMVGGILAICLLPMVIVFSVLHHESAVK